MSKHYLFASLVLAACTTTATTGPAPRPPVPSPTPLAACVAGTPGTRVLFQITETSKHSTASQLSNFVLYTNGSWSHSDANRSSQGCLDLAEIAKLEAALAPAKWQVTEQQLKCMAYASSFTTYSFKGVAVHTQEICDGKMLDADSAKALQIANAIVRPLVQPASS